MSKKKDNPNGVGNPRSAKAQRNAAKNEAFRAVKAANGGVGQREKRRVISGKNHRGFFSSLTGKVTVGKDA